MMNDEYPSRYNFESLVEVQFVGQDGAARDARSGIAGDAAVRVIAGAQVILVQVHHHCPIAHIVGALAQRNHVVGHVHLQSPT